MQIVKDRQALHRIPELDRCLPKTMEYLKNSLAPLKCRLFSPIESSLCAFFDFGKSDAIAFRADCDALPIFEKTGADYASTHSGAMHACGHDGHMAILLELARRLNEKETLPHNVLLIFQPAEETIDGAKWICRSGVLESHKVKAIFGLHIWPELSAGEVFSRANELMARSCEVDIEITGKSAHIGKASEGLDALKAGMLFYTRAREREQALPENVYRILNFGFFESGTVRNAISRKTVLKGSMRSYQDEIHRYLRESLFEAARYAEEETGCTVTIDINEGTPPVINPPELLEKVCALLPVQLLDAPSMTAEDFSEYQQCVPGLFFFLGLGDVPALHSDTFDFDETILTKGADFFEALAEQFQ